MEQFRFSKLGAIPYTRTGNELAAVAPVSAPSTYSDPAFFNAPILMQGQSPECGGFSLAFLLEYLFNSTEPLSGSFAYSYEKTVDGVPSVDGTNIAAIGTTAHKGGTCLNPLFHDDGTNITADPTTSFDAATDQAINNALTRAGYLPLLLTDLSWSGIQAAISKYGAVILEVQVGDEWWTAPSSSVSWAAADVLPIRPPKTVIDSHFIVAGGQYDENLIDFANSWSEQWGNAGFGCFEQDYIPFVKNGLVLYKMPPSVQTVVNHPTLTQPEKNSIIQQIITDIEQEVSLIQSQL